MSSAKNKNRLTWKKTHPVSIKVRLLKDDVYVVYVSKKMTIAELKDHLELVTGIPYNLQKISYLDAADLLDNTTLAENRILPKTEVDLDVWTIWRDFVKAAIKGDCFEVFRLGVTHKTKFEAPQSQYILSMSEDVQRSWINLRAFVALCIGANRGFMILCKELISHGVNLKTKTPCGRTALHMAASHGRQEIISLLTDKGIKVTEKDSSDCTAIKIAILFAKTAAEKQLGSILSKQKYARLLAPSISFKEKEVDKPKTTQESKAESLLKKLSRYESMAPPIENINMETNGVKEFPKKKITKNTLDISSNACIMERSNNQIETETIRVNNNDHLEQEDFKEEEEGGGRGEEKGDMEEEDEEKENKYSETIRLKDSLCDYLISLKSEESAVQYPVWAVDAHLKQIESVNNSAKLVLLKLHNHEQDGTN